MPHAVVEGLFLFACWAPPLTVVVCGLLLLVKTPARTTSPGTAQTATAPR
jgi:hypothetical protein